MKKVLLAVGLLSMASSVFAAGTSCDTVKDGIDAKLKAKNVANYSLDVVAKGSENGAKVVGTCDGGSKAIVYKRG